MKLKPREKKVLAAGIAAALLIIVWYAAGSLMAKSTELTEAYEVKQALLDRYAREFGREQAMMERLEETEKQVASLETGLLEAASPVLATAYLQSIVEGVLKPGGVEISNIKALKAVDSGPFKAVGVEVTFYATTSKLVEILYEIEAHSKAVYVDHIDVRIKGGGLTPSLRVVMGVGAGYSPGKSDSKAKPPGRTAL